MDIKLLLTVLAAAAIGSGTATAAVSATGSDATETACEQLVTIQSKVLAIKEAEEGRMQAAIEQRERSRRRGPTPPLGEPTGRGLSTDSIRAE